MNTLLLFAIFLITGCSTVSHRRPSSEDPWKVLVSLDTHVHIESGKGYEDSLNNTFLSHSLLLSSSYSINSPKDFSNRLVADEDVSKIVSQYPLKFSGLCGLNLSWPDATEVLTKCLKMPGMVGVKIHDLGDPDSFSENDKFKALKEVLKIMSSRNLILLWHVRSDPSMDNEKFRREVNKIIISSTLNKNIYFVFAHAVDSLDHTLHLQIVLDSMRSLKTRPENIFIELSGTMDICENEPTEEKMKLWEKFGFDYILLGSDSSSRSWPGQAALEEELSVIKNSNIPDSYKKKILVTNGLKILKKVNLPVYNEINGKNSKQFNINELKTHSCESLQSLIKTLMRQ